CATLLWLPYYAMDYW
nr:immunoglobulin heavy chain junction region [Mus musculus]